MKRAAWLLVAVFGAWLLAWPAAAFAARPSAQAESSAASRTELSPRVELLPATPFALRVAPAPIAERLPIDFAVPRVGSWLSWLRPAPEMAPDARRALQRVQVRRAVPRLNDAEPPWCVAV